MSWWNDVLACTVSQLCEKSCILWREMCDPAPSRNKLNVSKIFFICDFKIKLEWTADVVYFSTDVLMYLCEETILTLTITLNCSNRWIHLLCLLLLSKATKNCSISSTYSCYCTSNVTALKARFFYFVYQLLFWLWRPTFSCLRIFFVYFVCACLSVDYSACHKNRLFIVHVPLLQKL